MELLSYIAAQQVDIVVEVDILIEYHNVCWSECWGNLLEAGALAAESDIDKG